MKGKQILGIITAGIIFVFVCVSSALTNSFTKRINKTLESEITKTVSSSIKLPSRPFIGVVRVEGTIINTSSTAFQTVSYDHKATLSYIDQLMKSDSNKGILLYVNSPGGSVYDSDELYLKLKEYSENTQKPIWTYMADQACSGGYYISMASDKIYANRNSWTGSIGVIISLSNYKELYDKLGIKEIDITSGENKAMGSGGLKMTKEQKDILQSIVDESYDQFTNIVAEGREMSKKEVKKIADGRIYTAYQALDLGLIDQVDTYKNMKAELQEEVGSYVEFFEPEFSVNIWSSLFASIKDIKKKSEAEILSEFLEKRGNGVPMYYAGTRAN